MPAESYPALRRLGLFLQRKAQMVGITEHPLENQARLVELVRFGLPSTGERLNEPEGAHVKCSLLTHEAIRSMLKVVSVHEAIGK